VDLVSRRSEKICRFPEIIHSVLACYYVYNMVVVVPLCNKFLSCSVTLTFSGCADAALKAAAENPVCLRPWQGGILGLGVIFRGGIPIHQ